MIGASGAAAWVVYLILVIADPCDRLLGSLAELLLSSAPSSSSAGSCSRFRSAPGWSSRAWHTSPSRDDCGDDLFGRRSPMRLPLATEPDVVWPRLSRWGDRGSAELAVWIALRQTPSATWPGLPPCGRPPAGRQMWTTAAAEQEWCRSDGAGFSGRAGAVGSRPSAPALRPPSKADRSSFPVPCRSPARGGRRPAPRFPPPPR